MMLQELASIVSALAQTGRGVPLDRFRTPAALLMGVAVFTIVFATLWLMAARRRARAEGTRKKARRGGPPGAWGESARRLRLPPNDGLDDDDTRDIDPSDLSPGDVDLRTDDDDDANSGRGRKGRTR